MKGTTIHSKTETPDMYDSIDAVAHALVSKSNINMHELHVARVQVDGLFLGCLDLSDCYMY